MREHCFHPVPEGVALPVGLTLLRVHERCCYCGIEATTTSVIERVPVEGHGPHFLVERYVQLNAINHLTGEVVSGCAGRL